MAHSDPTRRFSGRVDHYTRYRPGYPAAVLDVLAREAGLSSQSVVADIGSGTGISSKLFLDYGCTTSNLTVSRGSAAGGCEVYAVEPNDEMREAAEAALNAYPSFHSVRGTAEHTTLPAASMDLVVAGQAFHWFDREQAKQEFVRILRPLGQVVLMWNVRRVDSSPFLREYESLLQEFGTDYREVRHANIGADVLRDFFADGSYQSHQFENAQTFDWIGCRGRLLSSSYVPGVGEPRCTDMLNRLEQMFERYQQDGHVRFDYDTQVYVGHVRA